MILLPLLMAMNDEKIVNEAKDQLQKKIFDTFNMYDVNGFKKTMLNELEEIKDFISEDKIKKEIIQLKNIVSNFNFGKNMEDFSKEINVTIFLNKINDIIPLKTLQNYIEKTILNDKENDNLNLNPFDDGGRPVFGRKPGGSRNND